MRGRPAVAICLVLTSAVTFGAAMSVIHGSQGGVRATVGNLSAPWLLLAFGAGAWMGGRRIWRGAASGLAATALALCAFYVMNIWVLGIFGHGPWGDLRFALSTGAYYIRLGLLSGPVMGALGAQWRRQRSRGVGLAATGLLVLEPIAWLAYRHGHLPRGFLPVAAAEIGIGVALSVALVVSRRGWAAA